MEEGDDGLVAGDADRMMVWVGFLVAGLALTAYAGGYQSLSPELNDAVMDYGFAALFAGLHVFVWRGEGRVFMVLRMLVWAFYATLTGLFLWAYFPRGILPLLKLMASGVTLPMAFGLLAVVMAAMFRRRRRAAVAVAPSQPAG